MASAPKWFDADYYLNSKLVEMHENGYTSMTKLELMTAFQNAGYDITDDGLYQHFEEYGNKENVSPNQFFDADYYFQSKAKDFYGLDNIAFSLGLFLASPWL